MSSKLNEEILKTALDVPVGEIKIHGEIPPTYADAIDVHQKKKKEIEKKLKDKKPELKKPFLGTKGTTTIMPKTADMKKLKLSEDLFKNVRSLKEHMNDAPEAYEGIFRVIDNMEHIINYIDELTDEEFTYADLKQSYDVLDEAMTEFEDYLFEIKEAEVRKGSLKEAAVLADEKIETRGRKKGSTTADIWERVYNELNGEIKGIEAKTRIIPVSSKDRYRDSELGFRGDDIIVKGNSMDDLAFGYRVANTYGIETELKEHTSRYAPYRFELIIHPFNKVNESIKAFGRKANKKDLNESANGEIYSKVVKHFEYGAPGETVDTVCDIVDRAVSNVEEGYDIEEAVFDALDSGLIYHKDNWAIKHYYEDSELAEGTYESLYHDVYSIVSDLIENSDVDESLKESKLPKTLNIKASELAVDADDEDVILDAVSDYLSDVYEFCHDGFEADIVKNELGEPSIIKVKNIKWDIDESLKESYTEVDTIECGEETYRVVGGGFNTNDALVSVEDEDGNKKRLSSGDVVEFYTWYDKNGNVIHEPSDDEMDESLNEERITLDDKDKEALNHIRDYRNYKYDLPTLHRNLEKVYGSKKVAVPRFADLDNLSNKDIDKILGESLKKRSRRGRK